MLSSLGELPDEAEQQKILQEVRSDSARIEVLKESFATLDKDKSGVPNVNNISESMNALGVHKNSEVLTLLALLVPKRANTDA